MPPSPEVSNSISVTTPFAVGEITVVIASLAVGGAERIVVDWAARVDSRWQIHLVVLFDQDVEWIPPDHVRVTRFHGRDLLARLRILAADIATSDNPVCVCHLLSSRWLTELEHPGVTLVYVYHNAPEGWEVHPSELPSNTRLVIAVSAACARDLRCAGWRGPVSIIRHIPPYWRCGTEDRSKIRKHWNIPDTNVLLGMVGGIKPQKNYTRALSILSAYKRCANVTLVIIGGRVKTAKAAGEWELIRTRAADLGDSIIMTDAIPGAAAYIPAFDVLLNTSDFEGLSISTLEALVQGVPVVATHVGGQGELGSPDLHLIQCDAHINEWLEALTAAAHSGGGSYPKWGNFPTFRLWTMAGIAPKRRGTGILFCTDDLNTGGAQRSLLNLIDEPHLDAQITIAVCRRGISAALADVAAQCGHSFRFLSRDGDVFTCAESIIGLANSLKCGTICFWNVDAKIRLLVVKALQHTGIRLVDVSPGPASIRSLSELLSFMDWIGFSETDYYEQIEALVLKYRAESPELCSPHKVHSIPNGVRLPAVYKMDYALRSVRRIISMCRIARTKHVLELVVAFRSVQKVFGGAELHIYGHDNSSEGDYLAEIQRAAGLESSQNIFLHQASPLENIQLHTFDVAVVLGSDQGCPNAVLEAMAAAVPTVTNTVGGTSEQIENGISGILLRNCEPKVIASAIIMLLRDRGLARRMGEAARARVAERFSMEKMACSYRNIIGAEIGGESAIGPS